MRLQFPFSGLKSTLDEQEFYIGSVKSEDDAVDGYERTGFTRVFVSCVCPLMVYQNRTYRADMMSNVMTIIARMPGDTLNIDLSRTKAFGLIFGPPRLMRIMIDHGKHKGETHTDVERDLQYCAVTVQIGGVEPGIMAKPLRSKFVEENGKNEADDDAGDGGCSGCPFPEHAQQEHRKYSGADKAGIFLNIGEPAFAADV